jgi:hypothetical protein
MKAYTVKKTVLVHESSPHPVHRVRQLGQLEDGLSICGRQLAANQYN